MLDSALEALGELTATEETLVRCFAEGRPAEFEPGEDENPPEARARVLRWLLANGDGSRVGGLRVTGLHVPDDEIDLDGVSVDFPVILEDLPAREAAAHRCAPDHAQAHRHALRRHLRRPASDRSRAAPRSRLHRLWHDPAAVDPHRRRPQLPWGAFCRRRGGQIRAAARRRAHRGPALSQRGERRSPPGEIPGRPGPRRASHQSRRRQRAGHPRRGEPPLHRQHVLCQLAGEIRAEPGGHDG